MTISEWLSAAEQSLAGAGIPVARLEAQVIAGFAIGKDRSWILANGREPFDGALAESLLARRVKREPLAYITGSREFYGRVFQVGPGVLVPRQETETLIEEALRQIDRCPAETPRVLDIGTGSGILAITLKLEREQISITGSDLSYDAIDFAQKNAAELGARVNFIESDLLQNLEEEQYHIVVCNPPYVAREAELMPEVVHHEPHLALYAGESGFGLYRRLANEARQALLPHGVMILEVGDGMAGPVEGIFEHNRWTILGVRNDLSGIARCLTVAPVSNLI